MSNSVGWNISDLGTEAVNASRAYSFQGKDSVIFINTGDVFRGKVLHKNYSPVSGLPGQAKKALHLDDILLTEIRPANGRFAYVDFPPEDYVVSTKFMVIESKGRVLPRFLYHVLVNQASLDEFQRVAESRSGTFPQITFDSIANFSVPVPPKREQVRIANILDMFQSRLDLISETNDSLESVAQAIFKAWFIDFSPVLAKSEGREPEGMSADIAALFPSEFVDSELGPIPKGWSTCPIYDVATYINGAAYKAFDPNSEQRGLPIIKIAELKSGVTSQTAYSDVAMPDKYRIETGDILFSWSGNPDTSIDTFVWAHEPAWLNQHIFRVLPHAETERSFVLQTLKFLRPVFAELARNKQTTGLGHVTVSDMKRLQVIKPDKSVAEKFDQLVSPIHQKVFNNILMEKSLTDLRDILLPRLLSGRLPCESGETAGGIFNE